MTSRIAQAARLRWRLRQNRRRPWGIILELEGPLQPIRVPMNRYRGYTEAIAALPDVADTPLVARALEAEVTASLYVAGIDRHGRIGPRQGTLATPGPRSCPGG